MSIKGVLFDLFDTLIHRSGDHHGLFLPLIMRYGHRLDRLPTDFIVNPLDADGLLDALGNVPPRVGRQFKADQARQIDSYTLVEGADKVLGQLKTRGVKLGLVSNLGLGFEIPIQRLGLEAYFDTQFLSFREDVAKPDPHSLWHPIQRMGFPENFEAQDFLMVGDDLMHDMFGALAAGLKTYWVVKGAADTAKSRLKDMDVSPDLFPHIAARYPAARRSGWTHAQGQPFSAKVHPAPPLYLSRFHDLVKGHQVHVEVSSEAVFEKVRQLLERLGLKKTEASPKFPQIRLIDLTGPSSVGTLQKLQDDLTQGIYTPTLAVTPGLDARLREPMGTTLPERYLSKTQQKGLQLGHLDLRSDALVERLAAILMRLCRPATLSYWERALASRGLPKGNPFSKMVFPATFGMRDQGLPLLESLNAAVVPSPQLRDYRRLRTLHRQTSQGSAAQTRPSYWAPLSGPQFFAVYALK